VAAFGREMAGHGKTHHAKADERQFLFAHCSSEGIFSRQASEIRR
jgi:hypothetical protein